MSGNNDADVCNQLHQIAGVRPSRSWLNSYRASQIPPHTADAILQHILYQDLRHVVREMVSSSPSNISNAYSQQWHQLVRSLQLEPNHLKESSMKSTLPESFRLMIQVEELVDVAQNAETRLSGSGGGQNRCLKLCISDGYYENGISCPPAYHTNSNANTESQAMLAMEVSPIPNLSMTSKAGLKILLHGPIDIRWGALLLHEGNALVLGGYVEQLAELQTKALEGAKREAGVGVDPTIRALIWNPLTGDEQDEDEGEQESGDVRAEPPAPLMGPQVPTMPMFNPAAVPNRTPPTHASRPIQQQQQRQHQQPLQQQPCRQPLVVSPNRTPMNITRPSHRASPDLITLPRQHAAQPSARGNMGQPPMARPSNPYARTAPAAVSSNRSKNASMSQMSATSSRSTANNVPPFVPATNIQGSASKPSAAQDTPGRDSPAAVPDITMTDASAAATPAPAASLASGHNERPTLMNLSFKELRELLAKALQDKALYTQNVGRVFSVSMKQIENHHHFSIQKVKKGDRKKEDKKQKKGKKYVYAIHAKFGGTSTEDGRVTCAISNDITEPYFGVSAAEMRNISREDKARGQTLSTEGGLKLKDACFKMVQWEAGLYHSPDGFFRSTTPDSSPSHALDGQSPILMLRNRLS